MARYRNYNKAAPKIGINKAWAEKLKKLNSQQLTLKIKQILDYEKNWLNIIDRYKPERSIILEAQYQVSAFKVQKQKEIRESDMWRKYIYDTGNTPEQDNWIQENLINNTEIRNHINLALNSVSNKNKLIKETNVLINDINKFFIDSGWQSEIFIEVQQTKDDFYNKNINDDFLFTKRTSLQWNTLGSEMIGKLKTAKSSMYEIRKLVNKSEKSAKLASYEGKSRSVGKSLMSSMKAKVKSPYYCPYCNEQTSKDNLHVDHINPVSNGGLSVERNLIPVCSECNLDKSDLSLRAFCKKNNLDYLFICDRLEDEGKFI